MTLQHEPVKPFENSLLLPGYYMIEPTASPLTRAEFQIYLPVCVFMYFFHKNTCCLKAALTRCPLKISAHLSELLQRRYYV